MDLRKYRGMVKDSVSGVGVHGLHKVKDATYLTDIVDEVGIDAKTLLNEVGANIGGQEREEFLRDYIRLHELFAEEDANSEDVREQEFFPELEENNWDLVWFCDYFDMSYRDLLDELDYWLPAGRLKKEIEWLDSIFGDLVEETVRVGDNKTEFTRKERTKLAAQGLAEPDGSFPIRNTQDLKDAIKSIGRSKDYDATKRWIIKRARALGAVDLLPDKWNVK